MDIRNVLLFATRTFLFFFAPTTGGYLFARFYTEGPWRLYGVFVKLQRPERALLRWDVVQFYGTTFPYHHTIVGVGGG